LPFARKPGERFGGRQKGTRNKSTLEIREMAQAHGPAAIRAAVKLMRNAESETARIAAINLLLDRGYGKAIQPQHHTGAVGHYDLSRVSDDALRQLEDILGSIAAPVGDPSGDSET
jgi:phage terminase small subunit